MTVAELIKALQDLEARGLGNLPVTDWEQSEISVVEISETTHRGYGIKAPLVMLAP